ncbi:MAG: recombinase family protein [Acetatifactor sp.]|nr:recombinase family protein [Acetatifactor sp.]
MKRVRMLLRVSSNQQLEADGDLSVQRQIVKEYVERQVDWKLDEKEYFEGSNSGYKNSVANRDILQEALQDARNKEYDILVTYKDDRVGRLMWEIGAYVMSLKSYGVDIYTVKDGCISPENDDIMGQMILALRYGNAQKSSSDTGMRVKDTAQKLVQQGKFMGGKAPYGYELVLSGELSKHGRALHNLVVIPEKAEVVKYIYQLSLNKEYGSAKIAKLLNEDDRYKNLAPNDAWKSGTITSILTNPIYAGHTAYKRRERINGQYHRLDSEDWIRSFEPNENIMIIDGATWDRTQERRKMRGDKYIKKLEHKDVNVIKRNDGMLPLVDVIHCGYCGCKLVNGSKYNYWTIKGTGEKRASKTPIYKCQDAWQGIPHAKTKQFRADKIETIIFKALATYVEILQENENVFEEITKNQNATRRQRENELKKEKKVLDDIQKKIDVLEDHIPDAMTGNYLMSEEYLISLINKQKEQAERQLKVIQQKEGELNNVSVTINDWEDIRQKIPSWQDVFLNADVATKRVLVNRLIERIDIKEDKVVIRFKINLNDFLPQPRMKVHHGVQEPGI